jgi:hypothetical protein
MIGPGLNRRTGANIERLVEELRAAGWRVYLLPLGIGDKTAFFEAVKAVLPLDPPLVGNRSWEALSDSVWGGLDGIDANRIAIVWPRVDLGESPDLETAMSVLEGVARSLGDAEATNGAVKEVSVVIT